MKNNKVLVVFAIVLSLLLLSLGGYIIYDKLLKEDNSTSVNNQLDKEEENNDVKEESKKNIENNNTEKEIAIEDLNGKYLDCNENRGYDNCSYVVDIENDIFKLGAYRTGSGYYGNITDFRKNNNGNYDIIVHEEACLDPSFCMEVKEERTYTVEISVIDLENKIIKMIKIDNNEINKDYYYAGNTYDEVETYINR